MYSAFLFLCGKILRQEPLKGCRVISAHSSRCSLSWWGVTEAGLVVGGNSLSIYILQDPSQGVTTTAAGFSHPN